MATTRRNLTDSPEGICTSAGIPRPCTPQLVKCQAAVPLWHSAATEADSRAGSTPAIVLLERPRAGTNDLIQALGDATGWEVMHSRDFDKVSVRPLLSSRVKMAIITVDRNTDAVSVLKQVQQMILGHGAWLPRLLVLSQDSLGPQAALRLERLGAPCLLRAHLDQVIDVVIKIQWQLRTDKSLSTLIIRRISGHVADVALAYGSSEASLGKVGPKIRVLAEHLALYSRTEHTTEMIADSLGVCIQSTKTYLARLRGKVHGACVKLGIGLTGGDIVWTRRTDGGYIHGLRCNVEIQDR